MSPARRPWSRVSLLLALAAQAGVRADEPKVKLETDLVYTKVGDADLKLDLARPAEGSGPFPAALVIHGGGWRQGNKRDTLGMVGELAKRGYVAASPQYRFSPKDTFPAQVHDVKAAVRWLKAHAKEYKVDPDRVGAVGFSAGGHLAMMLGLTGPADGLEGGSADGAPDTKVRAVVNFFGPSDLSAKDFPEFSRSLINDFLGGPPEERPEVTARASPLTFASKGDAPVLTFQGTKDPLLPYTQATRLVDALTAAGVPGRVELILGAGHGFGGDDLKRTLAETYDFLDQHLKTPGP
jgi:acetyl esterase/lipase